MSIEKLTEQYKALIKKIYNEKDRYKEEKINLFNFAKGSDYKNDLLIVGRAVNGWDTYEKDNFLSLLENESLFQFQDDLQWLRDGTLILINPPFGPSQR